LNLSTTSHESIASSKRKENKKWLLRFTTQQKKCFV